MKIKEACKLVAGSVVVYVVMAACAASGTSTPADAVGSGSSGGGDGSGSSGGGDDGSGSAGGDDSGGAMAIVDALLDPVPAAKADTTQSGSRLKAKYQVGSDGSRSFAGWHDSMLNVDCGFIAASDGTTRCVPIGTAGISGAFSDPGCKTPLAQLAKGCAPAMYASQFVVPPPPVCSGGYFYRIYQVGAVYLGPIYAGTPANCTGGTDAGDSLRATLDYFSATEVTPSSFVAATLQTDP